MTEHTAIPWACDVRGIVYGGDHPNAEQIAQCFPWDKGKSAMPGIQMANADFIVRACNNFEALLAAAFSASTSLMQMVYPPGPIPKSVLTQARNALTQLEAAIASAEAE